MKWPFIWASWLRGLTIVVYALLVIYEFFRPTSAEYYRTNGLAFSQDWVKSGWGVIPHAGKAVLDHIFSLSASTFFSFLLLSLAFALTFYLFRELDSLALGGISGYFKMGELSLLATVVVLSSLIASTITSSNDRIYYSLGLLATAATLSILLYSSKAWLAQDAPKSEA